MQCFATVKWCADRISTLYMKNLEHFFRIFRAHGLLFPVLTCHYSSYSHFLFSSENFLGASIVCLCRQAIFWILKCIIYSLWACRFNLHCFPALHEQAGLLCVTSGPYIPTAAISITVRCLAHCQLLLGSQPAPRSPVLFFFLREKTAANCQRGSRPA